MKSDLVLIFAIFGLVILGIGVLIEHWDIKLLYLIICIIGAIGGVPIVIPKIMSRIKKH